jgi:hypothetical protein
MIFIAVILGLLLLHSSASAVQKSGRHNRPRQPAEASPHAFSPNFLQSCCGTLHEASWSGNTDDRTAEESCRIMLGAIGDKPAPASAPISTVTITNVLLATQMVTTTLTAMETATETVVSWGVYTESLELRRDKLEKRFQALQNLCPCGATVTVTNEIPALTAATVVSLPRQDVLSMILWTKHWFWASGNVGCYETYFFG